MEEALLPKNEEQRIVPNTKECIEELKKVSYIAAPMMVVTLSQYFLRVVPMMMVGHLDELALASTAIATSIGNVTGYSVLVSFFFFFFFSFFVLVFTFQKMVVRKNCLVEAFELSILEISHKLKLHLVYHIKAERPETSLSNSGGTTVWNVWCTRDSMWASLWAKQYKKLGIYTYGAILSLFLVCIPISVLWIFMDKLLIFLGQDPLISVAAGKFAIWLIPSLFPYAILESMVPFLQAQSLILPMLLCSVATLCFHVPLCWVLIFTLELGTKGAALAISLSFWVNVILLGLYLKYSPACAKTRTKFSKEVFQSIREFLRFAFASAGMTCLEWWSFEVIVLLSGLLPNPKLQSSVLSICLTTSSLHYLIPYSIGAAASTRVSNELGAGNSKTATLVVYTVMAIATAESIIVSIILYCYRSIVGYAYSNEYEVVEYVKEMMPVICVSIVMDSLQAVLSGVARGSGWQHIGTYINFGAYYLFGIPIAIFLGFFWKLSGEGLWAGLVMGSAAQVIIYSFVTSCTSWQKQANKARERIFRGRLPDDGEFLG